MIDLDWVRRLIELVDESNIDSIEIRRWATRIRLSKSPPVHLLDGAAPSSSVSNGTASDAVVGSGSGPGLPATAAPQPSPAEAPPEETAGAVEVFEVISPMVGTFYRAPAPDAPAYVEVGDRVRKGQTLCILEAMKLMNELESEVSGTIREICLENAEPVEYGEVLFRIEPDGSN
ncbi:MAG: acetyl-CoA carboxylase biotin carboxyl carrier protein [Gemmatimonadota bacterium]